MTSGALTRIVGFTETTYNQTPSPANGRLVPAQTFQLRANEARDSDPTLSGFRGNVRSVAGRREVSGAILATVAPENVGWWLTHLIGRPVTTSLGGGVYQHVFSVNRTGANSLPAGALFEVDYGPGITTPGRYMRYSGCKCNQATLALPNSGFPTLNMDWLGAQFDGTAAAPLDAVVDDTGHSGWSAKQIQATVLDPDGYPLMVCFDSLNLTFGNDLDADQWCVGNGGVRHALPPGFVIAGGNAVAHFDDPALMNLMLADTDVEIEAVLRKGSGDGTPGNEQLTWTVPAAVFEANTPPIDGPRGLRLQANFTAHRTVGEIGVSATLINSLAAVY